MAIRQTRIYAPAKPPYDTHLWAETMMARIIKPLAEVNDELDWFWFTRYASVEQEFADSDGSNVPAGFFGSQLCRSIRFRFEIHEDKLADFENRGTALIEREGCWISDWRDYGVGELCADRFLGELRSAERRQERLPLVKNYVNSVSRLALHLIVPADDEGRFRFETNDHELNPTNSTLYSLHHFFCNPTEVPLTVLLIANENGQLIAGTRTYPPNPPPDPKHTWNALGECKIRY